jgi:hypothetical protein
MLGMKVYDRDYVDSCRAMIEVNVEAYDETAEKTRQDVRFETCFFNNLVLNLDYMFVHRCPELRARTVIR